MNDGPLRSAWLLDVGTMPESSAWCRSRPRRYLVYAPVLALLMTVIAVVWASSIQIEMKREMPIVVASLDKRGETFTLGWSADGSESSSLDGPCEAMFYSGGLSRTPRCRGCLHLGEDGVLSLRLTRPIEGVGVGSRGTVLLAGQRVSLLQVTWGRLIKGWTKGEKAI